MTYVEWLRARGALKITAIVLGALFLVVVGLRVWVAQMHRSDALAWVGGVQARADSHVTRTTLPGGTTRTVIDNAREGVHIVIDDHGYGGKHITILESGSGHHSMDTVSMGSFEIRSHDTPGGELTTIDTGQPEGFASYAAIAAVTALIVATVLGAPFARENDGHLEIALTKPIARLPLGLATIGVDILGILASWAMTVVFLVAAHALFEAPHLTFGATDLTVTGLALLGVFAWYAMLCAATASMRRNYGAILAVAWAVAPIVAVVANLRLATVIGSIVHAVAVPLSWIDPFSYMRFGPAMRVNGAPAGSMAVTVQHDLLPLLLLVLGYGALALWQWERLEA